ncbi:hypothetical protein [Pedobacter cryoconitis]|uniref:Uncharacterized protein n=1 Tax=Pedobacter cryoconitis TaxID=188932 RepID=A0A7X0MMK6_9SPHI|nr:hypothetical protein [Pedobacter cryoconitis]MBB6502563.1 hypothetical protein [Pedobacter cryoconitis]
MIKTSILVYITLASVMLYICTQDNGAAGKEPEKPLSTTHYMAIDRKDTARMELNQFSKKVEGKLIITYHKKANNRGEIKGKFKGDTLFVNYVFKVGKNKPTYKNPLAFLRKDGKLTIGIGKMENTIGRTYFKKDIPIDFEQGRFTFIPVP